MIMGRRRRLISTSELATRRTLLVIKMLGMNDLGFRVVGKNVWNRLWLLVHGFGVFRITGGYGMHVIF
jgi:hypothetical protein